MEGGAERLPLVAMMDFLSDVSVEISVLAGVARVKSFMLTPEHELPEEVLLAEGILAWHLLEYNKEMLDKLVSAKVIVRVGIGIDSVDLKYAGLKGVYVANVPDYGVEEVADSSMNHILNLLRRTVCASLQANDSRWNTLRASGATRLRGQTLGIVGFGKIGKALAVRAKAFGLRVIFQDPAIEDGVEKSLGVERVDTLKELVEVSDILSLNCWLDSNNRHLINRESLSWIKPSGIFFVNTARGGLVDEGALLEAIKGK
eukprot:TRINITY_DN1110_c0_g1_i5.p1 TRINITY_DN1110_c0_g1~~TRINITY_DN1110_c0_g1_i5.p1  ORF type:complete len:259 (-),score=19.56 TRINITY_DN1110_c0_g1_i5:48-824(-)